MKLNTKILKLNLKRIRSISIIQYYLLFREYEDKHGKIRNVKKEKKGGKDKD